MPDDLPELAALAGAMPGVPKQFGFGLSSTEPRSGVGPGSHLDSGQAGGRLVRPPKAGRMMPARYSREWR